MSEEAIKRHAYALWEEAGRPADRDDEFWEKAKELAAIEENHHLAMKPATPPEKQPWGEPVEPEIALENQGDFPGMADQGEEQPHSPRRSAEP
jgi:hypothetical protein